jgi:nitrite reductase/ring-hydroxylating ferredoxin subunit
MTNPTQSATSDHPSPRADDVSRRTMLRGVAVGGVALPLLAACGGGDSTSGGDSSGGTSESSTDSSAASPSASASAGGGGTTVAAADVPVGGGTILKDEKLVVTQPSKGDFKAFSAICTHQKCVVGSVESGEIVCACHGSHFSIEDGSAVRGPATKPLEAKQATVKGSEVSVT